MALVTEMKEMFKQASVLQPLSQAVVILETFYAFMISCAFMIKPQNISCNLTGLQSKTAFTVLKISQAHVGSWAIL